ncbi:hypothetical protein INT45_011551 [Circinella minor]|uniref:Uncharacterized protein n=1 Tax=Circinella minor TaxID=1195481 RepID=A0A8H7VJU6_9FUNG|nr:hypothetical protein INT45_011551 [Circinella minor]
MIDIAVIRFNERHVTTTNDARTTLTDSTALDSPEIWNPLWDGSTDIYAKYHLDELLRNYWQIYLDDVEEINPFIEAGRRLFISSMDIIGSSYCDCDDTRRDDFYVQMIIDMDKCKRRRTIKRKPRSYFGEVIFYFRHTQQSLTKLVALVEVWEVELMVDGVPYQQRKFNHRYIVVSVGDIYSIAAIYTSTYKRRCIVWPEMYGLDNKELGLLSDLY